MYFLGTSFRNGKSIIFFKIVKMGHGSIWNWLQKYRSLKYFKKRKIKECVVNETVIKANLV
ncbi:MAG TPA: hypothetical protein VN704_05350 [Verrucomicrobiae bacterium]|nr:hypothetical protein [Verrucomicrobiae bacterium]